MVIQCKNLISLYILPDQRRGNLLVINMLVVIIKLNMIKNVLLVRYGNITNMDFKSPLH